MSILDCLNPKQQEAVQCTKGPLLILAGAGSGKTRVLTHRIAYLLAEKKIAPWNILAITFTNKAAQEMRLRLKRLIGEKAEHLWVHTFHAACVKILRREIKLLGYENNFGIYDSADQQTLIKMVLKEMNIDDRKYPPRSMNNKISNFKNELKTAEMAQAAANDFYEENIASIYSQYQEQLKKNNALDFDDLIMLTVELFQKHPEVLEKYQELFQYILVDEYQDTNTAQYMFVQLLAQKNRNICVVGDDNQSIYGWRGADIRNILKFEKDYPETKTIKLEQNYRSTQNILDAANSVIVHNLQRKEKNLWTEKAIGEKILLYPARDEKDEAFFIARTIKDFTSREENSYQDFAILCRVTAQFRAIETGLVLNDIPYRIFGGLRFYDRKEIKDILAYLKVLANPSDEVSLKRIINTPKRGIGEATWEKLVLISKEKGQSVFDLLIAQDLLGIGPRALKSLQTFRSLMNSFEEFAQTEDLTALTEKILLDTGYLEGLEAENTIESETKTDNLKEFLTVTKQFDAQGAGGNLASFLMDISLLTDIDNYDQDDEAVVLMTMHGAKGLEFPVVFIAGAEEGLFPHARSLSSDDPNELEEERRLCYVAMTRAEERIYMSYAWQRNLYGQENYNPPSRFIEEISVECLEGPGVGRKSERGVRRTEIESRRANLKKTSFKPESDQEFNLGDKVEHFQWGIGIIVSISGTGEDAKLSVAFPDQGIKTLIVKYAPLKRISV